MRIVKLLCLTLALSHAAKAKTEKVSTKDNAALEKVESCEVPKGYKFDSEISLFLVKAQQAIVRVYRSTETETKDIAQNAAILTVSSAKDCLAVRRGMDLPEKKAFAPFGEIQLRRLKVSDDQELLLVHSQKNAGGGIQILGTVFAIEPNKTPDKALKQLWENYVYESDPFGEELKNPVESVKKDSLYFLKYKNPDEKFGEQKFKFDSSKTELVAF